MNPPHLTDGKWEIKRTDVARPTGFTLAATDKGSGDLVFANITVGDFGGYDREEDLGIPSTVKQELVWCLQRIEPREAKVAGGTKAILKELCLLADREHAWVHSEVQPNDGSRTTGIISLLKRHGFETAPLGFHAVLYREPCPPVQKSVR